MEKLDLILFMIIISELNWQITQIYYKSKCQRKCTLNDCHNWACNIANQIYLDRRKESNAINRINLLEI